MVGTVKRLLIGLAAGLVALAVFGAEPPETARAATVDIQLQSFATGLDQPIDLTGSPIAGDNRLFVAQRGGVIRVVNANGTVASGNFLDVSGLISTAGEGGLIGIALHPNYASNGFFYLYYVNTGGSIVIARYTVSGSPATSTTANSGSAQILITIPHPGQTNHYGGDIAFGPDDPVDPNDPYLFFATGDGGAGNDPPNNAQNIASRLGKMLRLDVNNPCCGLNYRNPPSNPFVGPHAGADEVFDYGLRNPFRFNFDRVSKALYLGDVGQGAREEIDVHPVGTAAPLNFGWRCFEGTIPNPTVSVQCSLPNHTPPSAEYIQNSPKAVTGGVVYRGTQQSKLYGYYLAADFYTGDFYTLRPVGGTWEFIKQTTFSGRNLVSFGEDNAGEAFAADISNGTIYRIAAPNPWSARWVGQSAAPTVASGDQTTVSIDFQNTGTENWTSGGGNPVRLGASNPLDRLSRFRDSSWLSPTRPTGITGQVNGGALDTGDTTIEPGNTARFQFKLTGPGVDSTRVLAEYFRPLAEGITWMDDQGVHLPVTVQARTYAYQWVSQQNPPVVMQPGQTSAVSLDIRNTGTATWRRDNGTPTNLGTTRPRDRASPFANGTWASPSRVTFDGKVVSGTFSNSDTVAPNEIARFSWDFTAPAGGGNYKEYFEPVLEQIRWLGDVGIFYETYVAKTAAGNPNYDYEFISQSPYPSVPRNGTATLTLRLRNAGRLNWLPTGDTPVRLGTERPRDRPSAFENNPSWISPTRIKLSGQVNGGTVDTGDTTIEPGQIAEFQFLITARPPAGPYPEHFAPVAEGLTWMRDLGIFWRITVT